MVFAALGRERGSWCHKLPGVWPCLSPPPSPWASSSCSSWNGGTPQTTRAPSKRSRPCLSPLLPSTCRRTRAARTLRGPRPFATRGPARSVTACAQTPPFCPHPVTSSATAAFTHTWRPTTNARLPGTPVNCNTWLRSTRLIVRTLELWRLPAEDCGLIFKIKSD